MSLPVRRCGAGAFLDIRLTPNAAQNRIEDVFVDSEGHLRLKIKVTAIPEKGTVNAALVTLLSKSMKCGKGRLELVAGMLDRNKSILVRGNPDETETELKEWLISL